MIELEEKNFYISILDIVDQINLKIVCDYEFEEHLNNIDYEDLYEKYIKETKLYMSLERFLKYFDIDIKDFHNYDDDYLSKVIIVFEEFMKKIDYLDIVYTKKMLNQEIPCFSEEEKNKNSTLEIIRNTYDPFQFERKKKGRKKKYTYKI